MGRGKGWTTKRGIWRHFAKDPEGWNRSRPQSNRCRNSVRLWHLQNQTVFTPQLETMGAKHGRDKNCSMQKQILFFSGHFWARPPKKMKSYFWTTNCKRSLRHFEGQQFSKALILALVQKHLTTVWGKAFESCRTNSLARHCKYRDSETLATPGPFLPEGKGPFLYPETAKIWPIRGAISVCVYIYAVKLLSGPSLGFLNVIIWSKLGFLNVIIWSKFVF